MREIIEIRRSLASDLVGIERLYRKAFPDEDLLPLTRDLLRQGTSVLSLVAIDDRALVGHVIFTSGSIAGGAEVIALLGPLAVTPRMQRQGIGSALVRDGLRRQRTAGTEQVYVLGDPAYYGRFGFRPDLRVVPPYPVPDEWRTAWQSISLLEDAPILEGTLCLPGPWQRPALWAP